MEKEIILFFKEEAKRAKKTGLTKRQFAICEIIKFLLLIGCIDLLFNFYILAYTLFEILKNI